MLAGLLDCFVITPAASGSGVAKQGSVALQVNSSHAHVRRFVSALRLGSWVVPFD